MTSRIRELFVLDPQSEQICDKLNADGASSCEHLRDPCYLRCGVTTRGPLQGEELGNYLRSRWVPISPEERHQWLASVAPMTEEAPGKAPEEIP